MRGSWWSIGLLTVGLAFSTAAIGCGDDSDDTGTGGTGGAGSGGSSGKGGNSGKGGTGGSSGKGGTGGGGAITPAACVTQTTNLMKDQSGGLSSACISCICEANAKAITDCDGNKDCWALIACVDAMCPDPATQNACAQDKCITLIGGGPTAIQAGMVLSGSACSAKCVPPDDAGVDAGN